MYITRQKFFCLQAFFFHWHRINTALFNFSMLQQPNPRRTGLKHHGVNNARFIDSFIMDLNIYFTYFKWDFFFCGIFHFSLGCFIFNGTLGRWTFSFYREHLVAWHDIWSSDVWRTCRTRAFRFEDVSGIDDFCPNPKWGGVQVFGEWLKRCAWSLACWPVELAFLSSR